MKKVFVFLLTLLSLNATASVSSQLKCEMKREDREANSFHFRFITPNEGEVTFGALDLTVNGIHRNTEARYVGVNFFAGEKLVFIFLNPIFHPENTGIVFDIEVVSSIYGPSYLKCTASR